MVVVRVVVAIVGVVAVDMKVLISVVMVMVVLLVEENVLIVLFIVFSFGHLESENYKKRIKKTKKKTIAQKLKTNKKNELRKRKK